MDLKTKIEIRIQVCEDMIEENLKKIKNSENDFYKKAIEKCNYMFEIKMKTLKDLLE